MRDVHRQQGAAKSRRNIVTSLRLISDVDWKQLFERLSLVDVVLASESDFGNMDFPTRTLYRSAVEDLSRGSNLTELEIAGAATLAARRPQPKRRRWIAPGAETSGTLCSPVAAAPSKGRSRTGRPCEPGWRGSTNRLASAAT